jgi:hypothetical protein
MFDFRCRNTIPLTQNSVKPSGFLLPYSASSSIPLFVMKDVRCGKCLAEYYKKRLDCSGVSVVVPSLCNKVFVSPVNPYILKADRGVHCWKDSICKITSMCCRSGYQIDQRFTTILCTYVEIISRHRRVYSCTVILAVCVKFCCDCRLGHQVS